VRSLRDRTGRGFNGADIKQTKLDAVRRRVGAWPRSPGHGVSWRLTCADRLREVYNGSMIPLRDNIPSRTFPIVNYLMIAVCAVAFLAQLADQTDNVDHLVEGLGLIPARVFHPNEPITIKQEIIGRGPFGEPRREIVERELPPPPISPWLTL